MLNKEQDTNTVTPSHLSIMLSAYTFTNLKLDKQKRNSWLLVIHGLSMSFFLAEGLLEFLVGDTG